MSFSVLYSENHLRTPEMGDGPAGLFGAHFGVPDLRAAALVRGRGNADDIALERRADEIAFQLDGCEARGVLGQVAHRRVAAAGVGERNHRARMQEAVPRADA